MSCGTLGLAATADTHADSTLRWIGVQLLAAGSQQAARLAWHDMGALQALLA